MATKFDAEAIKKSAREFGAIMDDMAAFTALKVVVPNAGSFEVAKWLERIVQDRVDGVVTHAEHLQLALMNMETTLTRIATDFTNADGENAAKIKSSIADLLTTTQQDIASFDANNAAEEKKDAPAEKKDDPPPVAEKKDDPPPVAEKKDDPPPVAEKKDDPPPSEKEKKSEPGHGRALPT